MDLISVPPIIRDFLIYHETIKGHSSKTVDEYYLDLRTFFRFVKLRRGLVSADIDFNDIPIDDVDLDMIKSVTLDDVYAFLSYLSRNRVIEHNGTVTGSGLSASSRARKIATLRSFYKYLCSKAKLIDENPLQDLDSPKVLKSLPRFLNLDESKNLLNSVDGLNATRDYCILILFLTCGLRISEVIALNISDFRGDHLIISGKGNKERIVYLNEPCIAALNDYLKLRNAIPTAEKRALFLSTRRTRISKSTVHALVKKHLADAGIDASKYSAHKLRHTAATLMLHNGVDVRTLQELLGHEHLNTTQIYTHVESEGLREAAQLSPLAEFEKSPPSDAKVSDTYSDRDEK